MLSSVRGARWGHSHNPAPWSLRPTWQRPRPGRQVPPGASAAGGTHRGVLSVKGSGGQARAGREGKAAALTEGPCRAGVLGSWGGGRARGRRRVRVPRHGSWHPSVLVANARLRKGRSPGAAWLRLYPGLLPLRSWDRFAVPGKARPSCPFAAGPSLRIRNLGTPLFFWALEESVEAGPLP